MAKQIMVVSITGMVLLFSTAAFAQTATDVACTGCVGATDLATNAVTGQKIQNSAVTGPKIQNNAVTSAKISDETITSSDIFDGTIANADILDGTITASKINSTGLDADTLDGIEASQLLQNGQDATIGGLAMSAGNITSASGGDICIGNCSAE